MIPLTPRKTANTIVAILASVLCAWAVYKAFQLPMGHDESLSFAIFNWYPGLAKTANDHWVVTASMRIGSHFFGASEFVLRLVSVFSYCGFVFVSAFLARRFRLPAIGLLFWLTLNSAPLILGYSVLARGYSFSVSFSLFGFFLVCKAIDSGYRGRMFFLSVAALCFSLSALSILSFIYLIPSALAITFLVAFSLEERARSFSVGARLVVLPCCLFIAVLVVDLIRARELQSLGELYFGSDQGIVFGTLKSLVTYRGVDGWLSNCFAILLGVVGIASVLSAGRFIFDFLMRRPVITFTDATSLFLGITFLSTISVPLFSHSLYPVERVATYLILPIALYSFEVLDRFGVFLSSRGHRYWSQGFIFLVVMASVGVCVLTFHGEASAIASSRKDNPSKAIVSLVGKDIAARPDGRTFSLGSFWGLEPSLNYYRVTTNQSRLEHVTREEYGQQLFDYIYDSQASFAPSGSPEFLEEYEQIANGPDDGLPQGAAIYRLIIAR